MSKAEIVQVDLYSIIQPTKEAHFSKYGRHWDHDHKEKMAALKEGRPQKRLQQDRVARDIVRVILDSDDYIAIEGNNPIYSTYGAIELSSYPDKKVRERLHALKDDGLLDVLFGMCGDRGRWCFESEIIYGIEKITKRRSGEKPITTTNNFGKFEKNPQLREALKTLLKPFEAEEVEYGVLKSRVVETLPGLRSA